MGDVITRKCVLDLAADRTRSDYLAIILSPDGYSDFRYIPCRPKGEPRKAGGAPEWEYEIRDGRLHLTPSLLCTDTGFHTDFNWSVAFELRPEGIDAFAHCQAINGIPRDP